MFVASLHIDNEGSLGVRLQVNGQVHTVAYKTMGDGRIVFNIDGWRTFHQATNLQVGQAILVTGRTTTRRNLQIVLVIDIIHA